MYNIEFQLIYQDDYFFEVRITCRNEHIVAWTECYADGDLIDKLSQMISDTVLNEKKDSSWSLGTHSEKTMSGITFQIDEVDKFGHIRIKVTMSIPDVKNSDYLNVLCMLILSWVYGKLLVKNCKG